MDRRSDDFLLDANQSKRLRKGRLCLHVIRLSNCAIGPQLDGHARVSPSGGWSRGVRLSSRTTVAPASIAESMISTNAAVPPVVSSGTRSPGLQCPKRNGLLARFKQEFVNSERATTGGSIEFGPGKQEDRLGGRNGWHFSGRRCGNLIPFLVKNDQACSRPRKQRCGDRIAKDDGHFTGG